jgi:hypothetical protein
MILGYPGCSDVIPTVFIRSEAGEREQEKKI